MTVTPIHSSTPASDTKSTYTAAEPKSSTGSVPSTRDFAVLLENQENFGASHSEPGATYSVDDLAEILAKDLKASVSSKSKRVDTVAQRIATEVDRICTKSDRIQRSGRIQTWQLALARHRLKKILEYYQLGSERGRVELHSHLSAIAYRYVAPLQSHLGFQGRHTLLEDFLQGFYIEVIKAFRRENHLPETYTPRIQVELAEYMAFSEQYAKRRINLPGRRSQQLIVLRAQGFAKRQPPESAVDIEMAVESPKREDSEGHSRSAAMQQIREQMISEAIDPSDSVLRDRVITELVEYFQDQNQPACVDYLTLKLQDLPATEIDDILGLSARERDYLQQRFKYHVEKFARSHGWQLVHQWLGANPDQNLGMSPQKWQEFLGTLSPEQQKLLELKQQQFSAQETEQVSDRAISKILGCTPKQVHRRWVKLLEIAWSFRNS